jgi:hypothetical protein
VIPALSFKVEDRGGPRMLERLRRSVSDLRPAWSTVINAFKEQQRELFAGDGQEAGGWRPLSPTYAAWKARHHPGKRVLRISGGLEAAVTGRSSDFQVIAQPLLLVAKATTYYASFLDRQRELAPLTDARVRAWLRIVNEHILREARGGAR